MAKTILLADDSPTILRIVELTFSDTEIRVESVTEGAGVLDRVAALRADLVLADVALPGGSGYEICRRIKNSARPVPVVLLGGTFEPLDPEMEEACGADGHLIKPFEPSALRAKVEDLLAAERAGGAGRARKTEEPGKVGRVGKVDKADQVDEVETPEQAASAIVTPELVDSIARAVVKRLSDRVVREIARDVVPDLAATIIRERIRELEQEDPD